MDKIPVWGQYKVATPGALCRDSSVTCVLVVKPFEAENLQLSASSPQMACLLDGLSKPGRLQTCWCQHVLLQRQR